MNSRSRLFDVKCTCQTKTSELKFHNYRCAYRIVTEMSEEIDFLKTELRAEKEFKKEKE